LADIALEPVEDLEFPDDTHATSTGISNTKMAMWVYLASDCLLFGGLISTYLLYKNRPGSIPGLAGSPLKASELFNIPFTSMTSFILLMSSLTMVLAVRSAQLGRAKAIAGWLAATMTLGTAFLVVKGFEYHHKWVHHLIPGANFHIEGTTDPAAQTFFVLYFCMTGLHALHMIVGLGLLAFLVPKALRGEFSAENHNWVEGVGLYWHFVDIIWIFLFPLLYLLGRHHA